MSDYKRTHIYVGGRVQGVWFRSSTVDQAESLGLTGWVKNLADGRVEIVAEGPEEPLRQFIEWTKDGPSLARVREHDASWEPYTGEFTDFSIDY